MDRVRVAFACNDPESGHGRPYFDAVEISDRAHPIDTLVSLLGTLYEDAQSADEHAPKILWSIDGDEQFVSVMGQTYRVSRSRKWEGNWCWDACDMSVNAARYLLRRLLKAGFRPDEWAIESPFADLLPEVG